MYRESGKKMREGAEPSLLEQLLEANPSNASFITPSSSYKRTISMSSGYKAHSLRSGGRFPLVNSTTKHHTSLKLNTCGKPQQP